MSKRFLIGVAGALVAIGVVSFVAELEFVSRLLVGIAGAAVTDLAIGRRYEPEGTS